jgi:hypothetical protein
LLADIAAVGLEQMKNTGRDADVTGAGWQF